MVLAGYVKQTLDGLLQRYIKGVNDSEKSITDDFVKDSHYGSIETYSEIMGGMKKFAYEFEEQVDPNVNGDLMSTLRSFVRKALRYNKNPSQLYEKISDIYNQEVFNKGIKGDEGLVIILSKLYWEALKTLGEPDPMTGKTYYTSREEKENAMKIKDIIGKLLGKALYKYWSARHEDISEDEIMHDLKNQASPFYEMWEAVKSKIESLTPYAEVRDTMNELVMELEKNYIQFIQGSILAAYAKRSAPEHIINVLERLVDEDFLKNVFNEMYNESKNYINDYINQLQSAGKQQGGQQGNQPQQPSQPPAGQQPAHQQQQANQPQQNNQQGQQTT
jgi:hypothetical protein